MKRHNCYVIKVTLQSENFFGSVVHTPEDVKITRHTNQFYVRIENNEIQILKSLTCY
jgi:hypothetical protein